MEVSTISSIRLFLGDRSWEKEEEEFKA